MDATKKQDVTPISIFRTLSRILDDPDYTKSLENMMNNFTLRDLGAIGQKSNKWGLDEWGDTMNKLIEDHFDIDTKPTVGDSFYRGDKIYRCCHGSSYVGLDDDEIPESGIRKTDVVVRLDTLPVKRTSSGVCLLKPSYVDVWKKEWVKLEFHMMYPRILQKLIQNNKISFNNPVFGVIYDKLLEARYKLDSWELICEAYDGINPEHEKNMGNLIRTLLNYTYGALPSKKSLYTTSQIDLVCGYYKGTLNKIFDKFDTVAYINTDEIWVDGMEELGKIGKELDKLGLPYGLEKKFVGKFISKKNFVMYDDNNKQCGRGTLSRCSLKKEDHMGDTEKKEGRTLTESELLELPIHIYNEAIELVYRKKYPDLDHKLRLCNYCDRKIQVLSCICPEGKQDFENMLQEVRDVANRNEDRSIIEPVENIVSGQMVDIDLVNKFAKHQHSRGRNMKRFFPFEQWSPDE